MGGYPVIVESSIPIRVRHEHCQRVSYAPTLLPIVVGGVVDNYAASDVPLL